jgi:hypothetical protein
MPGFSAFRMRICWEELENKLFTLWESNISTFKAIYTCIYIYIYGKFLGFACISRTTVDLSSLRGLELNFFFIVPLECKV